MCKSFVTGQNHQWSLIVVLRERWLWPFELEEKIGEGGMGTVYRARFVQNDRRVAVKLLSTEIVDPVSLARFERELEVLKTLKHPHIVHCFGGVCEDKQHFYAMELVEGGTFDQLLRVHGRFSWEQAIEYTLQMCAALTCAHEHGIVHRDIKPGNFLVTKTGRLKLSDFGLASVLADSKLTTTGKTMGTIRYMAPEQIRGNPAPSPQTDLYGLGCVMFQMIAGRPPYEGNSPAEVMQQHLNQPVPRVSAEATDCPTTLENIVADLLQKDPDQRPRSAKAVARSLKAVTQTVVITTGTSHILEAESDSENVSEKFAEIAPQSSPVQRRLVWGCLVLLGVLLVWNVSLWQQSRAYARSEALWAKAYQGENEQVSVAAARALGTLARDSQTAVEILIEGLSAKSPRVRRETVIVLETLGARAKPAIPAMIQLQRMDGNRDVRKQVKQALKTIRATKSDSFVWYYVLAFIFAGIAGGGFIWTRKPAG
jgi:serine/threonine-protein kinase